MQPLAGQPLAFRALAQIYHPCLPDTAYTHKATDIMAAIIIMLTTDIMNLTIIIIMPIMKIHNNRNFLL